MIAGPPIILLGIDSPIGLALVRELGRAGVEVHGIAAERRGLGLHSRYLHAGYLQPADEAGTLALLRRIARRHDARFVTAVSMRDCLWLRDAADAGRLTGLRPLLASADKLRLVNDKAAIAGIAERLGIETPRTWQPRLADLAGDLPELAYPAVLKWRDPETAVAPLAAAGLDLLKTEYAHGAAELRAALERYRPAGILPMVQAYAPGRGLGQMFVMKDGAALLRFQHRRLHEWPPEGGVSTLCESVAADAHPELMARSEALLREIGWEGPAMVEYRYDEATGRAILMEINGRFWGSLPLAYHAGAHFALATYCALGLGRPLPPLQPYKAGMKARFLIPETRRLVRLLFAQRKVPDRSLRWSRARELGAYLKGCVDGTQHYVWSWRDPVPLLVDAAFVLRRVAHSPVSRIRLPRLTKRSGNPERLKT